MNTVSDMSSPVNVDQNSVNTTNSAEKPKKKRVVIALPGSHFSNNFLLCWTQALYVLWEQGYNVVVSPASSSFVTFCRMKTLGVDVLRGPNQKPFNGELDYDVFVSIDSDVVFSPAMLLELIETTDLEPVVSGYYMMADGKNLAVVKDWDISYFSQNGTFKFLTPADIETWKTENPNVRFMEVSYSGLGFFACRREVLESLSYPYFDAPLQTIPMPDGSQLVDMCSEDVAFAKNIKAKGYKINMHIGLRVGHEKRVVL
jgi:hypothetical protein